jgi:hypothetical protein
MKKTCTAAKTIHMLPDLNHAKGAVLNSLICPYVQRRYWHVIDEFADWYGSEPHFSTLSEGCLFQKYMTTEL